MSPRRAPGGPRSGPRAPKTAPRRLQEPPRARQEGENNLKRVSVLGWAFGGPPGGPREAFSSDLGPSGATFWSHVGFIFEALPAAFPENRLNHRGATGNQRKTTDNARDLP